MSLTAPTWMCVLRTFLIAIAPLSSCSPPGIPLYNLCPCLCPPSSRNYSSARTTTLPRTFSNHHIIIALLLLLPTATTEDRQRRHLLTLLHYWWAPVPSVHPRGIGQDHHHTPPPQWLWLRGKDYPSSGDHIRIATRWYDILIATAAAPHTSAGGLDCVYTSQ